MRILLSYGRKIVQISGTDSRKYEKDTDLSFC